MKSAIPEQLDLQRQAYEVLGHMLEWTGRERLPVISWKVSDAKSGPTLTGECSATDPIERHSDFDAWRTALSAEEWPNGIRRDGCLHLHTSVADYEGVTIVIFADIYDDERCPGDTSEILGALARSRRSGCTPGPRR
jgi:hypothetical protein